MAKKKSGLGGLGGFGAGRRLGRGGLSGLSSGKSKGKSFLSRLGGWGRKGKNSAGTGEAFRGTSFSSGRGRGGIAAQAARSVSHRLSPVEYYELQRDIEDAHDEHSSFYEDRRTWLKRMIANILRRK